MIPPRGQAEKITGHNASSQSVVVSKDTKQRFKASDYVNDDATKYAISTAKDQIVDAISEAVGGTPFGPCQHLKIFLSKIAKCN